MTQYGSGKPQGVRRDDFTGGPRSVPQQREDAGDPAGEFGGSRGIMTGAEQPAGTAGPRPDAHSEEQCFCIGTEYGFGHAKGINVGLAERLASALAGSWLFMSGLRRLVRGKPLSAVALAAAGGGLGYRGVSGRSMLYSALGVEDEPDAFSHPFKQRITVRESITIQKPVSEIYRFWRDVDNLGCVMHNLLGVEQIDSRRSRWLVRGPAEQYIEWEASIVDEEPDRYIAWEAEKSGTVRHHGVIIFEPALGDRGCMVHVQMVYSPPGGAIGALAAKAMLRDPCMLIRQDLQRLKQFLETGEIATSAGPSGRWSIREHGGSRRDEYEYKELQARRGLTGRGEKNRPAVEDEVTHASKESFPASDPPSWSRTTV